MPADDESSKLILFNCNKDCFRITGFPSRIHIASYFFERGTYNAIKQTPKSEIAKTT